MKRIFSGVQPSGVIHIGNYLGAVKQWIELQSVADESIYCIVDLHAITVPQDPKVLKEKILELTALYLAFGVDPERSAIFVQSVRPEHAQLTWILNCFARMGELSRMTQFKDKSGEQSEISSVGLFDYPVLMAADILLYQTTHVPVGEDQKQHMEITRDLAERFNNKFGQTFVVPEPIIKKEGARIMGLDDPKNKMSKSAASPLNYIAITDDAETIRQKIKKAVTDSGTEIKSGADKPALSNLLLIYSGINGKPVAEIENDFSSKSYSEFKESLAELIVGFLQPVQEKYRKLMADQNYLKKILEEGSLKVAPLAEKTLKDVKDKVGLGA